MKYIITVQDEISGNWVKEEIEAAPIQIKGFEDFEFIVHEKDGYTKGFIISEVSCGGRVATGITQKICLANALKNLKNVGVKGFAKMLEEVNNKIRTP